MKTKPISIRFDEDNLLLAINKSGIKKKQKVVDFLLSEYVRDLKPQYLSLPKDYVISEKTGAVNKEGKVVIKDITATPPKTNYTINTEIPSMPKREDFKDNWNYIEAKNEWKKKNKQ